MILLLERKKYLFCHFIYVIKIAEPEKPWCERERVKLTCDSYV